MPPPLPLTTARTVYHVLAPPDSQVLSFFARRSSDVFARVRTLGAVAASSAPDDPDDARDDSCDGIETSQLTSQSADRDTDNRIRLAKQRQAASRVATQAELALLQANQRVRLVVWTSDAFHLLTHC